MFNCCKTLSIGNEVVIAAATICTSLDISVLVCWLGDAVFEGEVCTRLHWESSGCTTLCLSGRDGFSILLEVGDLEALGLTNNDAACLMEIG